MSAPSSRSSAQPPPRARTRARAKRVVMRGEVPLAAPRRQARAGDVLAPASALLLDDDQVVLILLVVVAEAERQLAHGLALELGAPVLGDPAAGRDVRPH